MVSPGDAPSRGPLDAPVVIVEFSDFQCPFCARAVEPIEEVLAAYPDGVRFVYKQYPLSFHEHAFQAAEASLCAHAQGAFWAYHDRLFANQTALERADLEAHAAAVGLDMAAFRADLDARTYSGDVQADLAQGAALGVPGTPTLYVNGRMGLGVPSVADLSAVVEQELAGR